MKPGYVLSGGGARGFAHLGVLQFLEEEGLRPAAIAGTSAGAIAAALYAAGQSPKAILTLLKESHYFGWSAIAWQKQALFSLDTLKKVLKKAIPVDDFSALPIPVHVAVTDLKKGESLILSEGKLIEAICASAAVPLLFEPVQRDGRWLVDGGVLNNFPIEPLLDAGLPIIGVHVNRIGEMGHSKQLASASGLIDRCFHLAIAPAVYAKQAQCAVFIDVELEDYAMFDVKNADKIFAAGYEAASRKRNELVRIK